jgi:hypothetical protein
MFVLQKLRKSSLKTFQFLPSSEGHYNSGNDEQAKIIGQLEILAKLRGNQIINAANVSPLQASV